jgi:TrmH family RNA methyltransferase
MKRLSSEANPQFRRWLRIAAAPRAVRIQGQTLAEGVHLAQAALAADFPIDAVLVREGSRGAEVDSIIARTQGRAPHYELAPALYDRLAPVEQGAGVILALPIAHSPIAGGGPADLGAGDLAGDLVYLDAVQDPGNVGALIRTAAAAGVVHVLAAPGTAALWAPKVLRAAMGAHFRIRLHESVAPAQLAHLLHGPWLAAVAHGGTPLWSAQLRNELDAPAVGWVFGAEGSGASPAALAACTRRVRVPTGTAVESLNVAAAAAICLFERLRRRSLPC